MPNSIMARLEVAAANGDALAAWTLDMVAKHCRVGDAFRVTSPHKGAVRFVLRRSGSTAGRTVARFFVAH